MPVADRWKQSEHEKDRFAPVSPTWWYLLKVSTQNYAARRCIDYHVDEIFPAVFRYTAVIADKEPF